MSKWAPECTPCTPAWWLDYGCWGTPKCPPCSWNVPTCLPQPTAPMNPYYPFAPYASPYPQYGFEGCCGPPPPPYPAPYQMAANTPAPAGLYRRPCPNIYVGGACCSECATGAPCAGAAACCDACAAGTGCSCKSAPEIPPAAAGSSPAVAGIAPQVGAIYVSDAELDEIGAQIQLMSTDVNTAAKLENVEWPKAFAAIEAMKACRAADLTWDTPGMKCLQVPDPEGKSYPASASALRPLTVFQNERWTPFVLEWNAYRSSITPVTVADPTAVEALRGKFATLADEWTGPLGQKTRAVVPKPVSQQWSWEWYALVGGGLLLGALYFLGPAIIVNALRKAA